MIGPALPDQTARNRIKADLDTSLLVEAGAGSGKTTALVERMLALIETGRAEVDRVAAVTFTRKAASELRERFQTRLEERLAQVRAAGDAVAVDRLDAALRNIDRGFVGTIHSFAARLLRERPVDAQLDPGFRELMEPDLEEVRRRYWHRWLEERRADEDPALAELAKLGIRPIELYDAYQKVDENLDVDFPAEMVEAPDPEPFRGELEELVDQACRDLPDREPDKGWCDLQKKVRDLRFTRWDHAWKRPPAFFDALALVCRWKGKATQNRWPDPGRAKALEVAFHEFGQEGGPADRALQQWYAHRYAPAIQFAQRAALAFRAERVRVGRLTFQDLLMDAARLLRESPSARRDLGERYRYLLVDEFQDTDPIQAEVVFLLTADDPDETDWQRAVPRPGALFVVGDPKQSIYRFRRADIVVYQKTRLRFEALRGSGTGDVLELVANFRSVPAIEGFVNAEFEERFEPVATVSQAAFAPMRVQRHPEPGQGVWLYEYTAAANNVDAVAESDAERVASWIAARIESGERSAGDFLVLTYRRTHIDRYAAALEARNVPTEVSGSDFAFTEEEIELEILLKALLDPDDPTRTVAVLVGLFFGLDYEILTAHALAGGTFHFVHVESQPEGAVRDALARLREWWDTARGLPADVLIERLVAELGLFPYAAAGDLGAPRAGSLAFILEVVRSTGLEGDTSLRAVLEALEARRSATGMLDAETPLQPGRADVVRVMNLHRAKGTEAPVVILAHPSGDPDVPIGFHVQRAADGSARGFLEISSQESTWARRTIARPPDWAVRQASEREFQDAEKIRLLYVAATRARDELLVSRCAKVSDKKSFWRPFHPRLEGAPRQELEPRPRPLRATLDRSAEDLMAEVERVDDERTARRAQSYFAEAASRLAKKGMEAALEKGAGGRGREWGSAVHACLEAALRGLAGEKLRVACRAALLANARDVGPDGEPVELEEVVALVERMAGSEIFARAQAAEVCLPEVPFAWRREVDGVVQVVEGVIDLAFREPDGWVLVDWKTDEVADAEILAERKEAYGRQLEIYAEAWEALTGERVMGRELRFVGRAT